MGEEPFVRTTQGARKARAAQIEVATHREEVVHNRAGRMEGVGQSLEAVHKVEVNRIQEAIHKVEVDHAFMAGIINKQEADIHMEVAAPNILPWGTTDKD
jgi:CMP-2-keto-3-deoxyoctulosonic acid synthetase